MLSPTLLLGTEWIVHKYHQTLALFGKALDLKGCCMFGGAEGAPNAGAMAQPRRQVERLGLAGPPRQVGYVANSPPPQSQGPSTTTFASHLCYMHSSVRAVTSCDSHQRTQARSAQDCGCMEAGTWQCSLWLLKHSSRNDTSLLLTCISQSQSHVCV